MTEVQPKGSKADPNSHLNSQTGIMQGPARRLCFTGRMWPHQESLKRCAQWRQRSSLVFSRHPSTDETPIPYLRYPLSLPFIIGVSWQGARGSGSSTPTPTPKPLPPRPTGTVLADYYVRYRLYVVVGHRSLGLPLPEHLRYYSLDCLAFVTLTNPPPPLPFLLPAWLPNPSPSNITTITAITSSVLPDISSKYSLTRLAICCRCYVFINSLSRVLVLHSRRRILLILHPFVPL